MTAWRLQAACLGLATADHDPWATPGMEAAAKAVCAGCPVQAECLADAAGDRHTIRGGLDPEERAALDPEPDTLPGMPAAGELVERDHSRAAYVAGVHGDCARCRSENASYRAAYKARWAAEAASVTRPRRLEQTAIDLWETA